MRKIILALFAVALTASCSDSTDEPAISPATQKTLAEGLNVPSDGIDTTLVFPLASGSKIDVSYQDDAYQWCSAYQETDSVGRMLRVHVKCAASDSTLVQRMAGITITSGNKSYELRVRQNPAKLAYTKQTVYYIPNTGGEFDILVYANTKFSVKRSIYTTGSGDDTRTIDTSWAKLDGEYNNIQGDANKPVKIHFDASINTGLGRKAIFYTTGDSLRDGGKMFEIIQQPRQLEQHETIDTDIFSYLDDLLGNDPINLARMKTLKINGIISTLDLNYIASASGIELDTLDLSSAHYSRQSETKDRSIDKRMFFKSGIRSILLPANLDNIQEEAFASCKNLATMTIPASVTSIDAQAFVNSSNIKDIIIPQDSKLESLGEEAFNTGSVLNSLFIPASATNIYRNALKGLRAKELHVKWSTPPTLQGEAYSGCTLYVPKGFAEKYQAADYWKNYKDIREE